MCSQRPQLWIALALVVFLGGCSDSTAPEGEPGAGGAFFDGSLDPVDGSFLLSRVDVTPPGQAAVPVELIGRNLSLLPGGDALSLEVAVRNASSRPLFAPAWIWVGDFRPATVRISNADLYRPSPDPTTVAPDSQLPYGFDYSDLLGEDDFLENGETSDFKQWIFQDPGLVPFAFGAHGSFELQPNQGFLSGALFHDVNRNGTREQGEGGFIGGVVLRGPDDLRQSVFANQEGSFRFPVDQAGLYELTYFNVLDCICPVCFTTPHPLRVVLTAGTTGRPLGFDRADIGAYWCFDPVPVQLVDDGPDSLMGDPYTLGDLKLEGDTLHLLAGFSGCTAEHPFRLVAGRVLETQTVAQTWAKLLHDGLGEECRAAFQRQLSFDLGPIRDAHVQQFGEVGVVRIRFQDFSGNPTVIEFGP